MKAYIYIGRFYPRNLLKTLKEDSRGKAGGMSNHNFEMSIINGLCHQNDIQVECLTYPAVYSYPYNNKRLYTKKETYNYRTTSICSIGFSNLPIIKEVWATIALAVQIIKSSKILKADRINVIINTPNQNIFTAVRIAKWFIRNKITQTVIIPDIPSMVASMTKTSSLKGKLLNIINKSLMRKLSYMDGLVLLTNDMMDFISNKSIKRVIMEGIADLQTMSSEFIHSETDQEIILYTGTLLKMFGVMNLVNAFRRIKNDNVQLWLCGAGDSVGEIQEAAKVDKRIRYYGLVDSQTALSFQRQATILVNPRTSDGEYTKYSFPSKTIEYLLAGKSVIINRLQGIPKEYYEYVFTPIDESVDALANAIMTVMNLDSRLRCAKAKAGREFIINYKNSQLQVSRILDMINTY